MVDDRSRHLFSLSCLLLLPWWCLVVERPVHQMEREKACSHCATTQTPCWRRGPSDKPLLCNACGSRFLVKHTLEVCGLPLPCQVSGLFCALGPRGPSLQRLPLGQSDCWLCHFIMGCRAIGQEPVPSRTAFSSPQVGPQSSKDPGPPHQESKGLHPQSSWRAAGEGSGSAGVCHVLIQIDGTTGGWHWSQFCLLVPAAVVTRPLCCSCIQDGRDASACSFVSFGRPTLGASRGQLAGPTIIRHVLRDRCKRF